MKKKISDKIRLEHICDAIEAIENYTEGFGISDFLKDDKTKHAVISQFTFIGEAANHLSDKITNKYTKINWHEVVSLRNIIVHEYFAIDYSVIWNTMENFLQPLRIEIKEILEEEFNN